jgi:hypothetical protein
MTSQLSRPLDSIAASPRLRRLLSCGALAGPLFLGSWAVQSFTRTGFDPGHHPLSLLSLGPYGWVQIATFAVTGGLVIACSSGLRRVFRPGPGATWAPALIASYGAGLILAGIFVTDPGAGFPPGAPDGAPSTMSWHGILHEIGFLGAMLSFTAGGAVLARRFARLHRPRWSAASAVVALAGPLLALWPADPSTFVPRTMIATTIQFAYLAALALHERKALPPGRGFDDVRGRRPRG